MSVQPLAGIRVVDFTTGPAGGLATTVLADFGGDVLKVEPPDGDRFRSMPASSMWLRGKRSVALDLQTVDDRSRAVELALDADVVVTSGSPERLRGWGLDALSLRAHSPGLVHCAITGWGMHGPYTELPGYEGLVAAKFGRMSSFDVQLKEGRPVYAAVPVGIHLASQGAVHGILAALFRREATGVGGAVETSLLQALMPFDLVDGLARQLAERDGADYQPLRTLMPMPTLNYHPIRTSDGRWIQCGNLLEHLLYSFLESIDLLGELFEDERFQISPAEWSPEATEDARDRILRRVQEKTCNEWMEIFTANGNVAAETVRIGREAMQHPDLIAGVDLIEVTDPIRGPVTQIGPIAELETTPAQLAGDPIAEVGQHSEEILSEERRSDEAAATPTASPPTAAPPTTSETQTGLPLEGVTIVDLSAIIAGPLAMAMLSDLGARVIKIEPYGGDPFRQLLTEGRMAVKMNGGKESICIDLKTDAGQALLHEFVAGADAVVHNFRAGVPEKLGLGYEQIRAVKPDIVWAVVNGYGAHGPGALRPATHPVIGAASGGVAYQAGAAVTRPSPTLDDLRENARQIMAANESNPDPNTSVVAASAVLLALLHRARTGKGQVVRINMQVANAWANIDGFVHYEGMPERAPVDDELLGLHAGYRLYPTRDGWVFLAATTDAEFARFCTLAGCGELRDRDRHDPSLSDALVGVFATATADEWESKLTEAGVGCVRADGIDVGGFVTGDTHVLANNWAPWVEHTRFGTVRRHGPLTIVDGARAPDFRAAPLAGEHTDRLLAELGKDPSEIAQLRADRIVTSEPVRSD